MDHRFSYHRLLAIDTFHGWNWTDGCGEMSADYMNEIAASLGIQPTPSAFQVSRNFFEKSLKKARGNDTVSQSVIERASVRVVF